MIRVARFIAIMASFYFAVLPTIASAQFPLSLFGSNEKKGVPARPTNETVSKYRFTVDSESPGRELIPDARLYNAMSRIKNAELVPESLGALKGTLKLRKYVPSNAHGRKSELLHFEEKATWQLNYKGHSSAESTTPSDTEIVGGQVSNRQSSSENDADLKITYYSKMRVSGSPDEGLQADITFEYNLIWELSLSEDGVASGVVSGFTSVIDKLTNEIGPREVTDSDTKSTIESSGVITVEETNTYNGQSGSSSKTVYHPSGTVHKSDGRDLEYTYKGSAYATKGVWFRIYKNNQKTPSKVIPPKDPCEDVIVSRLLNEDYSPEVKEKLDELEKKGVRLQPLGDRESNVTTIGLPFANFDRYSVTIPKDRLPKGFDPRNELLQWGRDMNSVPLAGSTASSQFAAINTFSKSVSPIQLGDVLSIEIGGYRQGDCAMLGNMRNLGIAF
jgi:hypothetical protein